jgi:sortase A
MARRYSRSNRLKYKKRRQQAGSALAVSLVVIILGGLLFFGVSPMEQRASGEELVERSETPTVAQAPEAIEEGAAEPEIVQVPDIPYNASEDEAREMLEDAGLELGEVEREKNDEYDKGGVFLQNPLPNEEIEEGSKVGITLSDGPEKKKSSGDGDIPDPGTTDLYLTVPKMGLMGDYVANASDEGTLMNGAGKITETGFPWQESANTYIASHVYGYEGTGSWQHFAALPSMTYGDEVILADANGTEYVYEVSNIITVMPTDTWITEPQAGKDMVSLQTCVGPGWSERLVVQAERVDVNVPA